MIASNKPAIHTDAAAKPRPPGRKRRNVVRVLVSYRTFSRGWAFRPSLHEPWADTTSPAGRMVLTVFAGIAEFERALIQERTSAGRTSARARGVRFGRPPKLAADQVALARRLIAEGTSVPEAARILKVHRTTMYRALDI